MACVAHPAAVTVAKNDCCGIDGSGFPVADFKFPHAPAVIIAYGYGDL
jgi:hypothetical protein